MAVSISFNKLVLERLKTKLSLVKTNIFIWVFCLAAEVLYLATKETQQKLQQKVEHIIW